MSTARDGNDAGALIEAAREYSTAAVMLHGTVADRVGLSTSDLKALDLLQRRGPLTAGDLATHTGLATGSVTSLIDRLEQRRFVRRARDPADRRRVVVMLTGKLEETIAPLFSSLGRRLGARCRKLTAEQRAVIRDFLSGCADDMREETGKLASGARE